MSYPFARRRRDRRSSSPTSVGRLLGIGASAALVCGLIPMLFASPASAQPGPTITRASTASGGGQANADSNPGQPDPLNAQIVFPDNSYVTADGGLAVFVTASTSAGFNTVPAPGGASAKQVYLKNLQTGALTLLSSPAPVLGSTASPPGNGDSFSASISPDGKVVTFSSRATNLGTAGSAAFAQVYEVDLTASPITPKLITQGLAGAVGNGESVKSQVVGSSDQFIDFQSAATNLGPAATGSTFQVYQYDTLTNAFALVSADATGHAGDCNSFHFSADSSGSLVAVESSAGNLTGPDPGFVCHANPPSPSPTHIYLKNMASGAIGRIDLSSTGTQLAQAFKPSITADGSEVAFVSLDNATHLPGYAGGTQEVFVRNLSANTTVLASATPTGHQGNAVNPVGMPSGSTDPVISPDGHYVVFDSGANNLVTGATTTQVDVYERDLVGNVTTLVSRCAAGVGTCPAAGLNGGDGPSDLPTISADSTTVYFRSGATDLVAGDTNGVKDMFTLTQPGQAEFTTSGVTVPQGTASVSFTVQRTQGKSNAASINYTTVNGTAVAGTDYTTTSGTLNWAAGSTTAQTVHIPLLQKKTPDPTTGVSFTVTLSSPSAGFGIGAPSTFTVTIVGNGPPPPPPAGYWLVAKDGGIFNFGNAQFFGSTGGIHLNQPVVGMAVTPTGKGYWLVAADGGIFNFGDAHFFGSTGAMHLNQPVVGMSATPTGKGYWLVAKDGGIFNFGDAHFFGSTGGIRLNQPVVGMASTPSGGGYWLVASDGGIFQFGDAHFFGSAARHPLNAPVVGMATRTDNKGYWLAAADGGVFTFHDAGFFGSKGGTHLNQPVVGMSATVDNNGYWLVAADGGIFNFGDAKFFGSTGGIRLNQPVVGMARVP